MSRPTLNGSLETNPGQTIIPPAYGPSSAQYDSQFVCLDPEYGPEHPYLLHSPDAAARIYEQLLQYHSPEKAAGLLAILGATIPNHS
jgi:hypothetical protein